MLGVGHLEAIDGSGFEGIRASLLVDCRLIIADAQNNLRSYWWKRLEMVILHHNE